MKNLNLVLKRKYYKMTGESGKMFEVRKPTQWLMSRLLNKDGSRKHFSGVELCCGYRKDRATKIRGFNGWYQCDSYKWLPLPDGTKLQIIPGDIIILLTNY